MCVTASEIRHSNQTHVLIECATRHLSVHACLLLERRGLLSPGFAWFPGQSSQSGLSLRTSLVAIACSISLTSLRRRVVRHMQRSVEQPTMAVTMAGQRQM